MQNAMTVAKSHWIDSLRPLACFNATHFYLPHSSQRLHVVHCQDPCLASVICGLYMLPLQIDCGSYGYSIVCKPPDPISRFVVSGYIPIVLACRPGNRDEYRESTLAFMVLCGTGGELAIEKRIAQPACIYFRSLLLRGFTLSQRKGAQSFSQQSFENV